MNVLYHSITPEANKSSFKEFEVIDFFIKSDRNLVKNSLRLEGELSVQGVAGTRNVFNNNIFFNHRTGAHGLLKGMSVEINGQVVENISQGYAKYANLVSCSSDNDDDMYNSDRLVELKCPNVDAAKALASGVSDDTSAAQIFEDVDFSFKPLCCLNSMDSDLPMSRAGLIKVSFTLTRNVNFLMGSGNTANALFELSNLRLVYRTVDPVEIPQVNMRSLHVIKSTLQNPFVNISARVNASVDGMAISFIRQSDENKIKVDSNALMQPEGIDEIQYLVNDSTNGYLQYVIDNPSDMVIRGLEALQNQGHTNANYENIRASSAFLTGIKLPRPMDLSQNKISVQVKSSVSNAIPYNMYMFFNSMISL